MLQKKSSKVQDSIHYPGNVFRPVTGKL